MWRLDEGAPQLLALCREAGIPVEDLMALPVKQQREKAAERVVVRHEHEMPVQEATARRKAGKNRRMEVGGGEPLEEVAQDRDVILENLLLGRHMRGLARGRPAF